MKISSLEEMETVVENNQSLEWIGWDVVNYTQSPTAWMKPDGIYRKGEWFKHTTYHLSESGWEIPAKFVR